MWTSPLRALAAGVVLVAAVVLAGTQPAASGSPPVGSSFYTVRPDPRLCPSPLCGGYWVALANRAQTRCSDGVLRPRCYVAVIVAESGAPLGRLPARALVSGYRDSRSFEGVGTLGTLVVSAVWKPVGRTSQSGRFSRLRDRGVRCIKAPCFWLLVSRLNSSNHSTVSDLNLAAAGPSPNEQIRAEAALRAPSGLLAWGRIFPTTDGGSRFRAGAIFLRVALPRG
jgi:hypothetical protein